MENYYKILEVDKDASQETIEKVYKTLVKKYHPDLKETTAKKDAEHKIKKINEAYTVLSDKFKREEYDQLYDQHISHKSSYNSILNENNNLKAEINQIKNSSSFSSRSQTNSNKNEEFNKTNTFQKNNSNISENKLMLKKMFTVLIIFLLLFLILKLPFMQSFFSSIVGSGIFLGIILVVCFYIFFINQKH